MKAIFALIVLGFLFLSPNIIVSEEIPKSEKQLIQEYITHYSQKYQINPKTLQRVILCESTGSPRAINYNDGGKGKHSVGVLQFQESTFNLWEKKLGEDLDYYSYHDQIKLGSYMFSKKQQGQWTCARKLGYA